MKILQINSCDGGSTGRIMHGIAEIGQKNGIEVLTVSPRCRDSLRKANTVNHYYFGPWVSIASASRIAKYTGYDGCAAYIATANLIHKIKKESPDIIHLHNLHNSVVNLSMLFNTLQKMNIKVVWTLHDCWAFTGHCPYYEMAACHKWKKECMNCPQYREYPFTLKDKSREMFLLKKKLYGSGLDITFVCPSHWIQKELKSSFLCRYPSRIIYNGIDLDVFYPLEKEYPKKEKYIVLGVASPWVKRKGIDIFIQLPKLLGEKYQVIMVGVDVQTEKSLPDSIIAIHKTNNSKELVKLYHSADVFANPTRDEVLGLVNVEANACGIPVVTFASGGSPECISKESGSVVDKEDIGVFVTEIKRICETKPYSKDACVKNAKFFDKEAKYQEYIDLYKELVHE